MTDQGYAHNLSPLDLLEQKSRKMATEISDEDEQGEEDNDVKIYHPTPRQAYRVSTDDTPMWRPSSRESMASVSSFGGGILDSFRLSSLPGIEGLTLEDSRNSIASSRAVERNDLESYGHKSSRNSERRRQSYDQKEHGLRPNAAVDGVPKSFSLRYSEVPHQVYSRESTMKFGSRPSTRYYDSSDQLPGGNHHSMRVAEYESKGRTNSSFQAPTMHRVRHSIDSTQATKSIFNNDIDDSNGNKDSMKRHIRSSMPPAPRSQFVPPSMGSNRTSGLFQDSLTQRKGSLNSGTKAAHNTAAGSPHATTINTPVSPPRSRNVSGSSIDSNKKFVDMSLEEHVSLGISLHESGDLRESSYHWQYAAAKGDKTAMLLYGLAVRHGWGVRQNPTEAIKWLRKAMEESTVDGEETLIEGYRKSAMLSNDFDISSKNDVPTARGMPKNTNESTNELVATDIKKKQQSQLRKAQIGLALYELGMCYLNSWGIDKDEAMALKSFEMAGELGDCDALCEAAALYMHSGKGRKKDLQKAARLYREAGARGANMVGNSWIYKDKYMQTEDGKKKRK